MIRIAVCDDSPDFLRRAAALVDRWVVESGMPAQVFRFDCGDALLAADAAARMDIIFLDILMPLQNGIDTARELRRTDHDARIIFLTSSPEFALDSYEVKAQGYLLKPVTYEKMKETLDECCAAFNVEPKHAVVKTDFGFQKICFHEVEYIEAQNKRVLVCLRTGKTVCSVEPMHALEERFPSEEGFFRCHRSYLVYLPNVDHFNSTEIVTGTGHRIPIARGCGKAFQEAYFSAMFPD